MTTSLPRPLARRRRTFLALAIAGVLLMPGGMVANVYFDAVAGDDLWSLVAIVIVLLAPFLGIAAARMAARDLDSIRKGVLPSSAQGAAAWGKRLGMIGAAANAVFLLLFLGQASSYSSADLSKDSMIRDLNGLFAHAYQYRNRPAARNGGGGTYAGYKIPLLRDQNLDGLYTATILHSDTLQLTATWVKDSASSITVRLGPDGRPVGLWIYSGVFRD